MLSTLRTYNCIIAIAVIRLHILLLVIEMFVVLADDEYDSSAIGFYSFGIEGSCYSMKTCLPKMSNLESLQWPTLCMEAPPSLTFVCPNGHPHV